MTRLLIRLVNWLVFRAWPRTRRWLWLLYRAALVVALLLALLALLVTVCRQGLSDRPEDTGPPPWTTRVWAADQTGGVTIRATTGRATPGGGLAAPVASSVLFAVFLLLVVLASGAAILAGVIVCHGGIGASGAVAGIELTTYWRERTAAWSGRDVYGSWLPGQRESERAAPP
jgi:hypothetical protein